MYVYSFSFPFVIVYMSYKCSNNMAISNFYSSVGAEILRITTVESKQWHEPRVS